MTYSNPNLWHHQAPNCHDQLPLISHVGRGIEGDSYRVDLIEPDSTHETYLKGVFVDAQTLEEREDWRSLNINGGELFYSYNIRPWTVPQTFTMTFAYRRPGRPEWGWTTPPIPFIWDIDGDGKPDVDQSVGAGVATLYLKTSSSDWTEKLIYPPFITPDDVNTPAQGQPWTVNLDFGVDGDIPIPDLDQIAIILGITVEQIKQIIAGDISVIDGSDNIKDYVDDRDSAIQIQIDDINSEITEIKNDISTINNNIQNLGRELSELNTLVGMLQNGVDNILSKIVGDNTMDSDGYINWEVAGKIPIGNITIMSNDTATLTGGYIQASDDNVSTNDLWFK